MKAERSFRDDGRRRLKASAPVEVRCRRTPEGAASAVLGRLGSMEVRLARSEDEVRAAQTLRYQVFYDEMEANPDGAVRLAGRDIDRFDAVCDHLLVLDHAGPSGWSDDGPQVVGTYRLLREEAARRLGGFYSKDEYRIDELLARHPDRRFLELGRSCVRPEYRGKRTVELLWQGIWSYVRREAIDVMFGCASFPGTDVRALALPLSFLHHHALAPPSWRVQAQPARFRRMDRLPAEAIDPRAALRVLPPLVRGYLRLGGFVGDGAIVDEPFRTTDVLVVLPVEAISQRYIGHYGEDAQRYGG